MKNRLALIVLVVLCLGLGIGLIVSTRQVSTQQTRVDDYSNQVVVVQGHLSEQRDVNAKFEKDLEAERKAMNELTNNFTRVSANLTEVSANLAKTGDSLKASQQEVVKRDTRISELENQNQALDKHATELSTSITNLTTQIADTEKKLAASEGDKAFLEKELKRMMAEKAELERQFNDLAVLRAQVAKIKEELNIARRIEWIRQGLFASAEQKGAQKLMQSGTAVSAQAKAQKASYDLNVEVTADGSVKVIPPLTQSTNSPPAK